MVGYTQGYTFLIARNLINSKQKREQEVFKTFAVSVGYSLTNAAIRSCDPPHPDILFTASNGDSLAFELVQLIDQTFASSIEKMLSTISDLNNYYENLDGLDKEVINQNYANAIVFINFFNTVSMNKRRQLIPDIFSFLTRIDETKEGDIQVPCEFKTEIERITIHRGSVAGPKFDTASATFISDPTVEALNSKLEKNYESHSPIHLLAYIDTNPMLPDEIWLDNLQEYIDSIETPVQFEAIWIFDLHKNELKYKWGKVN